MTDDPPGDPTDAITDIKPSESVRRVYALPQEMVDRIVAFQREKGLPSEVEAARRLLDDALKRRDTWMTIARRLQIKLKETKFLADAAREILVGHPLVLKIEFDDTSISYTIVGGISMTAFDSGVILISHGGKNLYYLDENGKVKDHDEEIPF